MRAQIQPVPRRAKIFAAEFIRQLFSGNLIRQWLHILALLLLVTSSVGCSTFHREWTEARKLPPNGLEGAWDGRWISDVNGHNGRLMCVIQPVSKTQYRARFKAHYLKILRFHYTALLDVATTNGAATFKGEANLGYFAGGIYTYEGSSTPTEFHSTYNNRYDHGRFEMKRP